MALFERISVLVVEDDEFMVSLLRQILLAAGFRHIRTARNGRDAIGMLGALKASRFNPTGQQPVDIVVADAFMPTVNGIDLLRWVRQDTASPNRFLPFIMMSGEADEDLVFNCRDVGVSEILAKPFSVSTLVGKLMQVIEKPRAYVLNRTFFGPDRRRMRAPLPADARERRVMTKDKIRLFTSAQTNLNVLSGHTWIFDFPNHLKGKLEVKNPQELSGPIDFARELARAETALAEAAEETKRWITNAAEELEAFLIQLRAALDGADPTEALEKIRFLARELRGHGGTFGYPLISQFAKSLHIFSLGVTTIDKDVYDLLKAHIDVIRIVVRQDAKRENDPLAQQIRSVLARAMERFNRRAAAAASGSGGTT